MMKTIKGFWEESFDGNFNGGMFVIPAYQMVGDVEIDESHPLVGGWESPPIEKAAEMKLQIVED